MTKVFEKLEYLRKQSVRETLLVLKVVMFSPQSWHITLDDVFSRKVPILQSVQVITGLSPCPSGHPEITL